MYALKWPKAKIANKKTANRKERKKRRKKRCRHDKYRKANNEGKHSEKYNVDHIK